ncbi:MAG: patatin-like phospholipase family protein [Silanimonas sp.]
MRSNANDAIGYHQRLLEDTLSEVFGALEPGLVASLMPRLATLELVGGAVLMREGESSDALYLVLSGRLLATRHEAGAEHALGEIGRGEPIGEMGVITGAPRTATVRALRDSVLVRLDGADFIDILQAWPRAGLALARTLVERLSKKRTAARRQRYVNVCVLPLQAAVDGAALAARLHSALEAALADDARTSRVALHTRSSVETALGVDIEPAEADALGEHRRLLDWMDQQEAAHALQVFAADPVDSAWTRLCLRQADLVLLAADADANPAPQGVELAHLVGESRRIAAHQCLWLLHPDDRRRPEGTAAWLGARPHLAAEGLSHLHLRRGLDADWRRLARIVAGRAIGLVLAGGGARGFAHVGVMQALEEHGVEWDLVGGTSIGAVMGFYAASGLAVTRLHDLAREAFRRNPTGDVNWIPVMSLLRGRRLRRVIEDAVRDAVSGAPDVEDLWKPFFCVASNCSRQRADVLRRGLLSEALRASVSIPAALPPVLRGGELLVDGGTFNNYPVDLMRAAGAARVIGIDLSQDDYRALEHTDVPAPWAFLLDRLFRRRDARRYKDFPSLGTTVVNVALMASTSHQKRMRQLVDLEFQPEVSDVGLLQWRAFDRVVAIGLEHARRRLAEPRAQGFTRPGRPAP